MTDKNKLPLFTPVFDFLAEDFPELNITAVAVLGKIWRYCQFEQKICYASHPTIAAGLNTTPNTVKSAIDKLIAGGLIEWLGLLPSPNGSGVFTNHYKLTEYFELLFAGKAGEVVPKIDTPPYQKLVPPLPKIGTPPLPNSGTKETFVRKPEKTPTTEVGGGGNLNSSLTDNEVDRMSALLVEHGIQKNLPSGKKHARTLLAEYPVDEVEYAIDEAIKNGATNPGSYIRKVLENRGITRDALSLVDKIGISFDGGPIVKIEWKPKDGLSPEQFFKAKEICKVKNASAKAGNSGNGNKSTVPKNMPPKRTPEQEAYYQELLAQDLKARSEEKAEEKAKYDRNVELLLQRQREEGLNGK